MKKLRTIYPAIILMIVCLGCSQNVQSIEKEVAPVSEEEFIEEKEEEKEIEEETKVEDEPIFKEGEENIFEDKENEFEVINQGASVVRYGDTIYYTANQLYKKDTGDYDYNSGLYAMDLNGENKRKIFEHGGYGIYIYNNNIYLIGNPTNPFYKISLDGTKSIKLLEGKTEENRAINHISLSDLENGIIYYSIERTGGAEKVNEGFYEMNLKENKKKMILSGGIDKLFFDKDMIYYFKNSPYINLFCAKKDGTNITNLNFSDYGYGSFVGETKDYFIIQSGYGGSGGRYSNTITSIHKNTKEIKSLSLSQGKFLFLIDDWIYFKQEHDNDKKAEIYKIQPDMEQSYLFRNDIDYTLYYYYDKEQDWIYYKKIDSPAIWKIHSDGTQAQEIFDAKNITKNDSIQEIDTIKSSDGWIYFYYKIPNPEYDEYTYDAISIWKIRLDGTQAQEIFHTKDIVKETPFRFTTERILEDFIYFYIEDNFYRVKNDGTQFECLIDINTL